MTERIDILYRPNELVEAQQILLKVIPTIDPHEASRILIELHKLGYRIVKVN